MWTSALTNVCAVPLPPCFCIDKIYYSLTHSYSKQCSYISLSSHPHLLASIATALIVVERLQIEWSTHTRSPCLKSFRLLSSPHRIVFLATGRYIARAWFLPFLTFKLPVKLFTIYCCLKSFGNFWPHARKQCNGRYAIKVGICSLLSTIGKPTSVHHVLLFVALASPLEHWPHVFSVSA